MHDTGLIVRPLVPEARKIVFGGATEEHLRDTLQLMAKIDQAHTVMLIEANIISRSDGKKSLSAIRSLVTSGFADVIAREPVRGLYMAYENSLASLSPRAADLHVGRSRNDLSATLFALRCRRSIADLVREILRLIGSIQASINRDGDVEMPVYSHRRPGMPGSWELYMSAIAGAVLRDADSFIGVLHQLDRCPLGAGAGAGTEVAIDSARTAALLGFGSPVINSISAVACRDAGLRAIAAAAFLGSNLGRFAADLMAWYAEQDAITLPDELVGASSVMPQKRNAFILEHILGKAGRVAGALTASLAACQAAPFANAVQVGTEAAAAIFDGLLIATEATRLTALIVDGVRPIRERFKEISRRGAVGATALALILRHERGLSFREAHHQVGAAIRIAKSHDPITEAAKMFGFPASGLDQASRMAFGGGAAAVAARRSESAELTSSCSAELYKFQGRWASADQDLSTAVENIINA
jgi:argininosuccinate lyase